MRYSEHGYDMALAVHSPPCTCRQRSPPETHMKKWVLQLCAGNLVVALRSAYTLKLCYLCLQKYESIFSQSQRTKYYVQSDILLSQRECFVTVQFVDFKITIIFYIFELLESKYVFCKCVCMRTRASVCICVITVSFIQLQCSKFKVSL